MNNLLVKFLNVTLFIMFFTGISSVNAAESKCQSQVMDGHTTKLCVSSAPFRHDYYSLWVGDDLIFTLPDDYIESISLTHTIPEDAAIEFALSRQGMKTVTISGGCTPISEKQELGGKLVGIEVGRSCSFTWGNIPIVKDMKFSYD